MTTATPSPSPAPMEHLVMLDAATREQKKPDIRAFYREQQLEKANDDALTDPDIR